VRAISDPERGRANTGPSLGAGGALLLRGRPSGAFSSGIGTLGSPGRGGFCSPGAVARSRLVLLSLPPLAQSRCSGPCSFAGRAKVGCRFSAGKDAKSAESWAGGRGRRSIFLRHMDCAGRGSAFRSPRCLEGIEGTRDREMRRSGTTSDGEPFSSSGHPSRAGVPRFFSGLVGVGQRAEGPAAPAVSPRLSRLNRRAPAAEWTFALDR